MIIEEIKSYIEKMLENGINKANFDQYQIGISIKNEIIFASIRIFQFIHTKINKIDLNILYDFAMKFADLFTEEEIESIKNGQFLGIYERLHKILFPYDIEVRIAGRYTAGMRTIMYLWPGLTKIYKSVGDLYEDRHIPFNKKLNGKFVMFKTLNGIQGNYKIFLRVISKDPYILYIVDSDRARKYHIIPYLKEYIEETEFKPKVLIIANKQDLPDAMSPEEIEKIMGYPTVGFSAIAPDAPEQLEQILINFLKD